MLILVIMVMLGVIMVMLLLKGDVADISDVVVLMLETVVMLLMLVILGDSHGVVAFGDGVDDGYGNKVDDDAVGVWVTVGNSSNYEM
ncbi:hypothetical protein BgiBS90_026653 [Biomphalaria glabrata]|nr:hypothetical protein BgiBS90_026653 [Biomphalaria glabrata]